MTAGRRKLIAVVIILTVTAGALGGWHVAGVCAGRAAVSQAKQVMLSSACEQADTLETLFAADYRQLEMMSDASAWENERNDAEIVKMLAALGKYSGFSTVFILDTSGKAVYGINSGCVYGDCVFFNTAVTGGRAMAALASSADITADGIVLAVPYRAEGEIVGVLCGLYYETDLINTLGSEAYGGTGLSYIADKDGNIVIAAGDGSLLPYGQNLFDYLASADIGFESGDSAGGLSESIASREPSAAYMSVGGAARIFAAVPLDGDDLPENDWILCSMADDDILAEQTAVFQRDVLKVICTVGAFLLAALALFLLLERDSRRIAAENGHLQQDLLDNMPCGAGMYRIEDGKVRLLYLNKRYSEIVGRSGSSIEWDDAAKVIHPDDIAELNSELRIAFREKRDGVCELRILNGSGGYTPFRIIGRIAAEDRDPHSFCCLFFPVETGEFKAVRGRQETELRYRSLVDHSGGGLTLTAIESDGAAVNVFTSDGMLRLMRIDREQWEKIKSNDIYAKVYPADVAIARGIFDKLRKNGETASGVYRLICSSGGCVWVNVAARCAIENGNTHIYAVHTDISAQKDIEEKNREIMDQLGFLNRVADDMLNGADMSDAIHVALTDILVHFGGQRSYVFEFDNEAQLAHNTYEVCAEGAEPAIELLRSVPFSAFSEWFTLFERDNYIAIENTAHLGSDREAERHLLEKQNITSLVVVPLRENGRLIGMMGVDDPVNDVAQMENLQVIGNYMSVMISRRNLMDELSSNNSRMEIMMNDTPGGFAQMVIHADSSVTPDFMNDGFCRMLGMTHGEANALFGGDAYAGVHPDDREALAEKLSATIAASATLSVRVRFLTGSGNYIPVEAYYRVWKNARGEKYLNGYYLDISERVAMEENYRRNIAYRNIIGRDSIGSFHLNITEDIADDGISDIPSILALGEDGTLSGFVSRSAELHHEQSSYEKFTDNFSRAALLEAWAHGRTQVALSHAFYPQPERSMWIRSAVDLFKNPDTGDVEGFIYARDLTNEHMLGLLMNTVVDVSYDFIVAIELSTGVYRTFIANEGVTTAFHDSGIYDEDTTVLELLTVIHPDDRAAAFERMCLPSIIKELEDRPYTEFRYRIIKDGEVRNKKCIMAYLEAGREHIVIFRMDETGTVISMQAALEAAQKANEAKSEFLSRMSHDIRTPMNGIIGLTRMARETDDVGAIHGYLDELSASSLYLLGLLNDVLTMSKIEENKIQLVPKYVKIADFLAAILPVIQSQAEAKDVHFSADCTDDVPYQYFDPLRVQQILLNLLNNAVKFTPEGGTVRYEYSHRQSGGKLYCHHVITDTGVGMSREFMKEMFVPFSQDANTENNTGTGLGLSICKSFIELMGGTIAVESAPGKGSTFTVDIPTAAADEERYLRSIQKAASGTVKTPVAELAGAHILLCEDNRINALITKNLLEKYGCIMDRAENGRLGVERFNASEENFYAAVLMDIRMPEMDGLTAARAIRALERDDARSVPIIAMSANAFEEDIRKSEEAGIDAYLAKPIDAQALYDILALYLQKRKK